MCTFTEKEMAEYVKHKKTVFHNNNPQGIKKAVSVIGKQPQSSVYVLGPHASFDESGNLLHCDECDVVWVSDMVSGAGVASYNLVCDIVTPLSLSPLHKLFNLIPNVFKHNTIPVVLMLGAACMAFHYKLIQSIKKCCPVHLHLALLGLEKLSHCVAPLHSLVLMTSICTSTAHCSTMLAVVLSAPLRLVLMILPTQMN